MRMLKVLKDHILKLFFGNTIVPKGLFDSREYFRMYHSINFKTEKSDDLLVAVSTDFKWGSIIATAKTQAELDTKIKDAILTTFEIPSSYAKEAGIVRVGGADKKYALA